MTNAYRTLGLQWHIELIHQHFDDIRTVSTYSQRQCIQAILCTEGCQGRMCNYIYMYVTMYMYMYMKSEEMNS